MRKALFLIFLLAGCPFQYSQALDEKAADQSTGKQHDIKVVKDANTVELSVVHPVILEKGKLAKIVIKLLERATGKPLTADRLKEVHTEKLHILLIDPTLTDYHHLHPTPSTKAGEYAFTFTPQKSGDYRVWADITPVASGKQEYDVVDLKGKEPSMAEIDRSASNSVTVRGLTFKLTFDMPLKVGTAAMGRIVVGKDGKPFIQLEPVMGAFAHIVAFNEDRNTIEHIHPMGSEPIKSSDRGGPDLQFHIEPARQGFTKLFVQVRVNGNDVFAPFGVKVE